MIRERRIDEPILSWVHEQNQLRNAGAALVSGFTMFRLSVEGFIKMVIRKSPVLDSMAMRKEIDDGKSPFYIAKKYFGNTDHKSIWQVETFAELVCRKIWRQDFWRDA